MRSVMNRSRGRRYPRWFRLLPSAGWPMEVFRARETAQKFDLWLLAVPSVAATAVGGVCCAVCDSSCNKAEHKGIDEHDHTLNTMKLLRWRVLCLLICWRHCRSRRDNASSSCECNEHTCLRTHPLRQTEWFLMERFPAFH